MGKPSRRDRIPQLLGTAIKIRRESKGVYGRELAAAIGMNSSYLSQIERNREIPSEVLLAQICQHLGTNAMKLLGFALMIEEYEWV